MKFYDHEHEITYKEYLQMDKTIEGDVERKSLFYILAINDDVKNHINSLYNFKEHQIEFEGINQGWQTSGSLAITRLAFNLYNNFTLTPIEEEEGKETRVTPLNIFGAISIDYTEYLFEGIRIRLGV